VSKVPKIFEGGIVNEAHPKRGPAGRYPAILLPQQKKSFYSITLSLFDTFITLSGKAPNKLIDTVALSL
jgi:hypothetical protein